MMRWLEKFMHLHGNDREHYEQDVRHEQQERNREYVEQQKRDIEDRLDRLDYLAAMAAAFRQRELDDKNSGTDRSR